MGLGAQTKTYMFYTEWFAREGIAYAPDIEASTADQILPLIRNNLGIGFVPEEFLKSESEMTGIYRLDLEESLKR